MNAIVPRCRKGPRTNEATTTHPLLRDRNNDLDCLRAKKESLEVTFSLANKSNLIDLFGLLMVSGAACPKCGYGTRKTSKNWRRCKRPECGERIHMVEPTKENVAAAQKEFDRAKAEAMKS